MPPKVLILRTAGTNCDEETEYAFQLAGARTEKLHVNVLRETPRRLLDFAVLAIPGGFSYGDDLGAGTVLANELIAQLRASLEEFIERGRLIIGICNGFQVLTKTGLLPGLARWEQEASLTINDSHKFEDRWVHLKASSGRSVLVEDGEFIYLPVAHAEGKFVARDAAVMQQLQDNGQVIFRYTTPEGDPGDYPWNPNGSEDHIAAICDPTGLVLGTMPHPERHVLAMHHPQWTREKLAQEGDGLRIFRRAVAFASQ